MARAGNCSPIHGSLTMVLPYFRGPQKRDTDGPGHGRFQPAGIGRARLSRVADHDREGACRPATGGGDGAGGNEQSTDSCGHQIENIVEACGNFAKCFVAFVMVADHAVQGVDRFVEKQPGQAKQQIEQSRRHQAVAEILRQTLNRRTGHTVVVEAFGIAPDDVAHRLTARRKILIAQGIGHSAHMIEQAAARQEDGDQGDLQPQTAG